MSRTAMLVVAVLALLTQCRGEDMVSYEGLRLDISALTLNRDIIASILPAFVRMRSVAFPNLREKGLFWTDLLIENIRVDNYKINENRFRMESYTYKYPEYILKGEFESVYFQISFDCRKTWLGLTYASAHGTAKITNVLNEIIVYFNETEPDVQLPHPWDVRDVSSLSLFLSGNDVRNLLDKGLINVFYKELDAAMDDFAHNLLKTYEYVEDVFPDDTDLVFRNQLLSAAPTMGGTYMTFAFRSNVTVNKQIVKRIYRRMEAPVYAKGDFGCCLPNQLVPDVLDAMGKGSQYDLDLPPVLMAFETNTMREFFDILPSLKSRYTGNEEFIIHCRSSRLENTVDITQRDWLFTVPELQHPMYCFFMTANYEEIFLTAEMFMRLYYHAKCVNEAFLSDVSEAGLYAVRLTPDLPDNKKVLLETHLEMFTQFIKGGDLYTPGIRVIPNRQNELEFSGYEVLTDEICFYYKEKRAPIAEAANQILLHYN